MFYTADGSALKPEYAANMDRLREWRSYIEILRNWAMCLDRRFSAPGEAGASCRSQNTFEGPDSGKRGPSLY